MRHPFDEPSADTVARKMIAEDVLMVAVGRALAPQVNEVLAKMQDEIDAKKRDQ